MGRSISPMREAKLAGSDPPAAPRLIVPMSLRLAIPRRVALQQSSPPLHQPGVILKQKEQLGKENPLNGKCASSQLSQPRGSPQKSVPPKPALGPFATFRCGHMPSEPIRYRSGVGLRIQTSRRDLPLPGNGILEGGNRRFASEGHIPRRGLIGTRFDCGCKVNVEVPPK